MTNTVSLAETIQPGTNAYPGNFCLYGNKLYFSAWTAYGNELLVYEGNSATVVSDHNPGPNGSAPYGMIVYNNRLYFTAYTPTTGWELYVLNDPTLSIQNTLPTAATINIYPNPVYDNATVSFTHSVNSEVTITLTNVLGQKLYSTTKKSIANVENKFTIPLAYLATGLYFCTLLYNDGQSVYNGTLTKQ